MTDPTDQARERLATSFGYQEVRSQDKSKLVGAMFARVAGRYDLMPDLMSVGVHRLWKAAMIDWLAPQPGVRLLDVAGGTGDIAFRVLDRLARRGAAPARARIRIRRAAPAASSAKVSSAAIIESGFALYASL
jgi:demethylmenaquinone methyltransferase/2-methoxy-6-polyprenyl-1,4-benzoquinol methylase